MPLYYYKARKGDGSIVEGELDVESMHTAITRLTNAKLYPVELIPLEQLRTISILKLPRRIKKTNIATFYEQLADLVESGVPLLAALRILAKTIPHPRLKSIISDLERSISNGSSLTEAVSKYPEIFPPLHRAMIEAGEKAAFIEKVFRSLAQFIEKLDFVKRRLLGSMIYPALLLVVGICVVTIAMVYFVPKFEMLVEGMSLPWASRLVFGISHFIRNHGILLLFGAISLIIIIWNIARTEKGRLIIEQLQLKIPVLGRLIQNIGIARFCRILGTMLHNGVPILNALEISKGSLGFKLVSSQIDNVIKHLQQGGSLSEEFSKSKFFTEDVIAMIKVAENTDKLDDTLLRIADTLDRRTDQLIQQLLQLVEPAILCVMAGIVALIACGILMPIFSLTTALGQGKF